MTSLTTEEMLFLLSYLQESPPDEELKMHVSVDLISDGLALQQDFKGIKKGRQSDFKQAALIAIRWSDRELTSALSVRLGLGVALVLLMKNGYELHATRVKVWEASEQIARGRWKRAKIVRWMEDHFTRQGLGQRDVDESQYY